MSYRQCPESTCGTDPKGRSVRIGHVSTSFGASDLMLNVSPEADVCCRSNACYRGAVDGTQVGVPFSKGSSVSTRTSVPSALIT